MGINNLDGHCVIPSPVVNDRLLKLLQLIYDICNLINYIHVKIVRD